MPKERKGHYDHKAYQNEYHKAMKTKLLSFNPANDEDMKLWEHLQQQKNVSKYIKDLIRKDIGKPVELQFPAYEYEDQEAIENAIEAGHKIVTQLQGQWEVTFDADLKKVLRVVDRSNLIIP